MAKVVKRFLLIIALMTILAVCVGYARHYRVIHVQEVSFADTQAAILPHLQMFLPDANEPRPAVLLFHGCGGVKPTLSRRATEFTAQGYVAIIVDSFKGRGSDWEKVCDGVELFGDQRAADVLVALEYARKHEAISDDQLFVVGYSHGAWAVLESLAYNDALPRGLTDRPAEPLAGLRGVVTWYPYCGWGTRFRQGWESEIPVLMLLAEDDEITAAAPCVEVATRQAEAGQPTDWRVFEGVGHGFDLPEEEWVVNYEPQAHQDALSLQFEFLARLAP